MVWSLEGGCWQLVPESMVETEYTRACRRKPRFSTEYMNAYLYLRRNVRQHPWLRRFDELETWLNDHPGDFVALPVYPSRHAKNPLERALGEFVQTNVYQKKRSIEPHESPVSQAMHRLLFSLDGWSVMVSGLYAIRGRAPSIWAVMYEEVQAWKKDKGNPKQLSSDPQEKKLAMWLNHQTKLLKQGKLTAERRALIEKEKMQQTRWEQNFVETENWFSRHDVALQIPRRNSSDAEEKRAANFLDNQKKQLSKMTVARREQLSATSWWKVFVQGKSQAKKKRAAASESSCGAVLKRPAYASS